MSEPARDLPRAKDLSSKLRERIASLCATLLPGGRDVGGTWHCGGIDGRKGDSLKVELRGAKQGVWAEFGAGGDGVGGDPLDLVRAVKGGTMVQAMEWAQEWLGDAYRPEAFADRPAAAEKTAPRNGAAAAADLWSQARPLEETLGVVYLRSRGITTDPGPWIRFHPELGYWHIRKGRDKPSQIGAYPALICGIALWPETTPVAVSRIYLARDGTAKARIADPDAPDDLLDSKKTLGTFKGGAVRLAPMSDTLAIAEGVETALSLLQALRGAGREAAVWACMGTSGVSNLKLPTDRIKRLVIATDADRAGDEAAHRLIALVPRDITITRLRPKDRAS